MSVYKGEKLVAGRSVDTYLARRPAWNKAIAISVADLTTGYKAPADGMVVGILFTDGNTSAGVSVKVNGVEVARNKAKDSDRILNVQCPVGKDDVITPTGDESPTGSTIHFVPFEDSTVSESGVEVVTPELIRNLHDPDWSQAVSITADQLVAGYTVPKRGIIVGSIWSSKYTNAYTVNIEINNVSVLNARITDKDVSYGNIQCPVCANDRVRLVNIPANYCSYKISFVPYKAQ